MSKSDPDLSFLETVRQRMSYLELDAGLLAVRAGVPIEAVNIFLQGGMIGSTEIDLIADVLDFPAGDPRLRSRRLK